MTQNIFGVDYAWVQQKLNDFGANPPLVVDGKWGPKSKAALIAFQQSKGLTADGIPGPITIGALGGGSSPTPVPPPPPSYNVPPGEIPNKMTPLSPDQAAQAISDGYALVTGKRPDKNTLGLLIGQTALETGNWKSLHNYNFGNKKASGGDRNWQFFRCNEIINGQEVWFDPPDPACKFAAYGSAAEGAAAYIHSLQSRPHWWEGLQSGTVAGFITGLTTAPKYFTANPTTYSKVLSDRMNNYTALAEKYAGVIAGGMGFVLGLVALGVFLFRKKLGLA